MQKLYVMLLCFVLFAGCKTDSVKPEPPPERQQWSQTCEMCGAEWLVTPNDPAEIVPPTVEWCFNDGMYCQIGLDIIIEQHEKGESPDLEKKWLEHCLECKGCRCAAFSPEEWRKITNKDN